MKEEYFNTSIHLDMISLFRIKLLYKILKEAFTFIDVSFNLSNYISQNHLISENK